MDQQLIQPEIHIRVQAGRNGYGWGSIALNQGSSKEVRTNGRGMDLRLHVEAIRTP